MKIIVFLPLFISILGFGQVDDQPLIIGEQLTFTSSELEEERILNVYLPDGYHADSTHTYPVIYLLDGSMHEDMLHVTGLVQFCSYSWINLIPECIVVGISNVNRYRDFTFMPENKEYLERDPRMGGSAAFIDFLEKEVKPMIENKYNTNDHRILIGQSLGGLVATQILIEKPDLFNHYVIVSPSLWYDDESLLSSVFSENNFLKSVFIAVGKEGKIMQSGAKKLYKKLTGVYGKPIVGFEYFPQHDHGDVLHNAVYKAFEQQGDTYKDK